jgi:DNA-binding winged helix-turn-helix (wHTH) protein/Tol biopolymer transport system component
MSKKPEQHLKVGEWWYLPQQDKLVKIGDAGEITSTADLDNLCQKAINYFILNAGRLITREELLLDVWGVKDVSDGRISRVIRVLRVALGDDSKEPKYIETIPKRGFRFIAPVIEAVVHNDKAAEPAPAPLPTAVVEELPPLTETPMRVESDPTLITGQRQLVKFTMLFALVSLIALLFFWQFFINKQVDDSPERFIRYKPITSLPGLESYFDVSPDGKNVIFSHQEGFDKRKSLKVLNLDDYQYRVIYSDDFDYVGSQWGPDKQSVAYQKRSVEQSVCEIRVAKVNAEARILQDELIAKCNINAINSNIDWSPDGKYLLYTDWQEDKMINSLVMVSVKSKLKDVLTSPPLTGIGDVMGKFSPDGTKISFIRDSLRSSAQIWIIDVATRSTYYLHQLQNIYPATIDWLDNERIIFNDTRWSLATLNVMSKNILPIVNTDNDSMALSMMPNGDVLASVGSYRKSKVRKYSNPLITEDRENSVIFESNRSEILLSINPVNSKPNALVSRRTGLPQIWFIYPDGREKKVTEFERFNVIKQLMFDQSGDNLAFKVNNEIVVVDSDGKNKKISGDDIVGSIFSWSSDNSYIYYESTKNGVTDAVKVNVENLEKTLIETESQLFKESSDGGFTISKVQSDDKFKLYNTKTKEVQLLKLPKLVSINDVVVKGDFVYYSYAINSSTSEVAAYNIKTRKYVLTGIQFDNMARNFSLSKDSKFFFITDVEIGDIDLAILPMN